MNTPSHHSTSFTRRGPTSFGGWWTSSGRPRSLRPPRMTAASVISHYSEYHRFKTPASGDHLPRAVPPLDRGLPPHLHRDQYLAGDSRGQHAPQPPHRQPQGSVTGAVPPRQPAEGRDRAAGERDRRSALRLAGKLSSLSHFIFINRKEDLIRIVY